MRWPDSANELPETREGERHYNRTWFVNDKAFAWERPFTKADIKRFGDTTPPTGEIVAVADVDEQDIVLSAGIPGIFTIPHFDGYSAILIQLSAVTRKNLRVAMIEAWLACAPTHLVAKFLES